MNLYGFLIAAEEGGTNVSQKIGAGKAALIALIGFLIVFLVLAVLVLLLMLFKFLFGLKINFKKKNKTDEISEEATQVNVDSDEETVAAITAAIACMLEAEKGEGEEQAAPFVIRKIKRIK